MGRYAGGNRRTQMNASCRWLAGIVTGVYWLLGGAGPPAWAAELAPPRITTLYDAFGKTTTMRKDWGFSAFIEYRGKRILLDTGNNAEIFANNIKAKGV